MISFITRDGQSDGVAVVPSPLMEAVLSLHVLIAGQPPSYLREWAASARSALRIDVLSHYS